MKLLVHGSNACSLLRPPTVTSFGVPSIHLPVPRSRCISTATSTLSMRIIPCSKTQMQELVPRKVTTEQWQAYWGVNKMERLQKVLESILLAYGGAWIAWFLSLVSASVGAVISSFAGTALVFNWMYAPYLYARKRNAKIWTTARGGQRLHYALYVGRIVGMKRIRRRAGKTVGAVAQEYLVLTVEDEEQRQLEIITQWQDSYRRLRPQMRCENLIVSSRPDFSVLAMVTESWIPAAGVWVGDYPYLQRPKFRSFVDNALLVDDEEREGGGVVPASAVGRSSSSGKKGGRTRDSSSSSGSGVSSSGSGVGSSSSRGPTFGSSSRSPDTLNTSLVVDRATPLQRRAARNVESAGFTTSPQSRYSAREDKSISTRASASASTNRRGEGNTDTSIDGIGGRDDIYDADYDPLEDVQAWLDVNTYSGTSDNAVHIDVPEWSTIDEEIIATTTTDTATATTTTAIVTTTDTATATTTTATATTTIVVDNRDDDSVVP